MIRLEGVGKQIPGGWAVRDLDLEVSPGETLVLFGPSGCGKTTTLRLIAGFDRPDQGILRMGGKQVNSRFRPLPPHRRGVSMVFQDLALWPHMTAEKHLGFAMGGRNTRDRAQRIGALLDQVRLGSKSGCYPHQLSGGEKQRLALARALSVQPRVLLMDEPLSSLDEGLRSALLLDIRDLTRETTMIYVTHDRREALFLADRVAVMENGRIAAEEYHGETKPGRCRVLTNRLIG